MTRRLAIRVLLLVAIVPFSGCASLGAQRIGMDRGDYTQKLRDSEKEQLLSNIVALRYGDAPLLLNVTSVISQYTREASGTVDATLAPASGSDGGDARGSILLRETPTVTYTPVSGERFGHSMLAPMPPASLLAMMEAGWAADDLLRITLRSVDGVNNASHAALFEQPADPRFEPVLGALRRLQRSGGISIRMRQMGKTYSGEGSVSPDVTDADRADMWLLNKLVGFRFDGHRFSVVFASSPATSAELAMTTRSMFEVLGELGEGVDVTGEERFPPDALVRIHSGAVAPGTAHAAIKYRGRWFWIDGADDASKRAFLLAQVLLFLNEEAGASSAPLVTIPAG